MPLVPVTVPAYAAVPVALGVPVIPRLASALNRVNSVVATAQSLVSLAGAPVVWGIYTPGGQPALLPDSIVSYQFRIERLTPDHPVEQGGFATYNKVARPYDPRVFVTKGGSVAEKADFMRTLRAMIDDLNLYVIVTPEETYSNVNLVAIDLQRDHRTGAQLIGFDLIFRQIRVVNAGQFTTSRDPSGAATSDGGTVGATAPDASQAQDAAGHAPALSRSQAISSTGHAAAVRSDVGAITQGMRSSAR